jgi:hypothetical protein
MIITCDDCKKDFDILNQGYSSESLVLCAECWKSERLARACGGKK